MKLLLTVCLLACLGPLTKESSPRKNANGTGKMTQAADQPVAKPFTVPPLGEKPLEIQVPKGWNCNWRTIPPGQLLRIWFNDDSEPRLTRMEAPPKSYGELHRVRFGSPTSSAVEMGVIKYPPGVPMYVDRE